MSEARGPTGHETQAPAQLHAEPAQGEADALARYQAARIASMSNAIGRASHDLRGILSPALLAVERLGASPDASIRRVNDIVTRVVDRATELIRETLEPARDETPPARVRARLRDLVDDESVAYEAAELSVAEIDPGQATEAFAFLFRDARDRGAATIRVATRPDAAILVADDGRAPPAEPFRVVPGTGAGGYARATARELIRAQGGDIGMDASAPGATVFRVTLPGARLG